MKTKKSEFCNLFEDKDRKRYMLCTPINILYLSITKKSKMVYIPKDDRDSILVIYQDMEKYMYPLGKVTGKTS